MKEVQGDIWDYHKQGHWIIITTNGTVRKDGACVMGKGVALQAKDRFPSLPYKIGALIKKDGNHVFPCSKLRLLTLPVKHNWWEKADLNLITSRVIDLRLLTKLLGISEVYMVRPGCGNGQLDWKDVKPILEKYLDDRFIICQK